MPVKTIIIVESGSITGVYSTVPAHEQEIELLDLDNAGRESPEAKDEMEKRITEISESSEYYEIIL
jgi:DUF917 family protein